MKLNFKSYLYSDFWFTDNYSDCKIHVRGWADYGGEILLNEKFLQKIKNTGITDIQILKEYISNLNGNYSIIISNSNKTFLLSDRMRTYPLIYYISDNQVIVTDNLMKYRRELNVIFEIDDTNCEQFLSSNYIIGPFSIYKDVYSTQSGEWVEIDHQNHSITRNQYFQWVPKMLSDDVIRDYSFEAKMQDSIFINVFKRMISSAPNVHNWIIPLSGGYDSRTIVNYLYKLGVKNVICFSYGLNKNLQSKISKQVSAALGYEWYFVDYNEWIEQMHRDKLIDEYIEYGFNGTSVAHLQDFPAVYALKKMGILKEGDVFVPGHALEVIAGNHLTFEMQKCDTIEKVVPIIRKHFSSFGYFTKERKQVFRHIKTILASYNIAPIQMAECFDWQERQTKFIANSVKVYEFFGFDSRIPEWDVELINYWENIGFNYRIDRNMFKEIFKNFLVADQIINIPFANDILSKKQFKFKNFILENIPFPIKKVLKKKGWYKSTYYLDEGSHLIYSYNKESINEYINSFNSPDCVHKYLKPYYSMQRISQFEVNSVTTLLNIRFSII